MHIKTSSLLSVLIAVALGALVKEALRTIQDMSRRERAIFAPLIVMTLLLGVYPSLVTDIIGPSVGQLVADYSAAVAAVATN